MTREEQEKQFETAMTLRDEGRFDEALRLLFELRPIVMAPKLPTLVNMMIGYVLALMGLDSEAEPYWRATTELSPRFELGSLGLFHWLLRADRRTEALREMLRLVSLRSSPAYAELVDDGFFSELQDLSEEQQQVAFEITKALAREHAAVGGTR